MPRTVGPVSGASHILVSSPPLSILPETKSALSRHPPTDYETCIDKLATSAIGLVNLEVAQ